MKKRLRELRKLAAPLGWVAAGVTPGGHLRLTHRSGTVYFAAASPSCARADRNMQSDLRRIAREAAAA